MSPTAATTAPVHGPVLSRRRVLGGALAVGLAATLTACGGKKPGQTAAGDGTTCWFLTGGSEQTFKDSFDRWNKAHSDKKIETEYFANDAYKEKIRTAVGAGNAPSLLYNWAGGTLADYVANSQVIDITDSTKDVQARCIPSVLEVGQVDGKQYALPNNNCQPVILYYSKPAFEKIGAQPPKTWDELMALVPKFAEAGYIPLAEAGSSGWPYLMWIEYLVDRIGGEQVFANIVAGKADAWSDPAVAEALTKIQDLVKAGGFGDAYGSVVADSNADVALVHTGKAAMILQGAWVYATFLQDAPDFMSAGSLGYAEFPSVEGGKGDASNIVGNPANYWSVSAGDEAAQQTVIDYLNEELFSDEYVKSLVDGGMIPAAQGAEDVIAASNDAEYLGFGYDMVKNAKSFTMSWDQALPAAQAQELLTNLSQIFLLQQTPEEFVEKMNATLA